MFDLNIRILVVDDSIIMRKVIVKCLHLYGARNLVEAADGRAAKKIIDRGGIELVLSDWNMPRMYGIDLLREVRANAATGKLPFIMISAEAQPHLIAEARAAKVSYYVIKPFKCETLYSGIVRVMKQAGKT